jgi:two-component sensor histidine kinase
MGPTGTQADRFTSSAGHYSAIGATREEPAETAGLLRRIIEHAPVLIAVVEGRDHRVRLANAAVRAVLPAVGPIFGRKITEVLPAPVGHAAVPFLDDVFTTARGLRLREFGTPVDARGTMRYWDANLAPLTGPDGVEAIVIMVNDVTTRVLARRKAEQMAEEALRRAREAEEARRMLDALMAYIPEGIAIADAPEMRVRRVSYHGLAMTKRPWQEVLEEIPPERIPERWQVYHLDGQRLAGPEEFPLARAARHGEIITSEQWLLRQRNGQLVPVLCNAGPIRDGHGRITGAVMSWLNVSSLAESQSKLIDAAKRFELAIEAGDLGMWDHNLVTGELMWSERCKSILGLRPTAELTYALFLQAVHPEDRERADAAVRDATRADGSGEYLSEFRVILPGGGQRWVAARGRAFFEGADARRRPVRLIGTFRDITGRVEAAVERENLIAQKDLLLREMSHRINNSLQIIASLVGLQAATHSADVRRSLEKTRARVQTVAQMHQRLLLGSKVNTVDIAGYLSSLCADVAIMVGQRDAARIHLIADPADLPTEMALSLGLIVNELVTNAFRHAYDEFSVAPIEVRFERLEGGFCLMVTDSGRGLPADFDPATADGLGMKLVSSLTDRLGGEVQFSPPGKGAQIRIIGPAGAPARPQRRSGLYR